MEEITIRLNSNFDLSDPPQQEFFSYLHEAKNNIFKLLTDQVVDVLSDEKKYRSSTTPASKKREISKDPKHFLQILQRSIAATKYKSLADTNYDHYIYIMTKETPHNEISSKPNYPPTERLSKLPDGTHFDYPYDDTRVLHTVIDTKTDIESFVKGMNEVLEAVYLGNLERIAIVTDNHDNNHSLQLLKINYHLFLTVIVYKIMQYFDSHKDLSFVFLLGDNDLLIFQEVVTHLRKENSKPLVLQNDRTTQIEQMAELCKTRNEIYKKTLKTALSAINEADIPILILGESGVGKSYLAKIIHGFSERSDKEFVEVNCGLMTQDRLYQKLWGWEKGSFSGAVSSHDGIIKRAEGGTLFLDEIDNTTSDVRYALLTFIENKQYEKLGGRKTESADVKLIFGSNKDLRSFIAKGKFEGDFYTRMAGRIIKVPPLRERVEDIDYLIDHFLSEFNNQGKTCISLDKLARKHLLAYDWPMNTRELHKTIRLSYLEAKAEGESIITKEIIELASIDRFSTVKSEDFENLIELIKSFLGNWESDKGGFLDEFIIPIVAKLYFDDSYKHLTKEQKWRMSQKIIGISGQNHNSSSLKKSYDKFDAIKDKLGL